MNMLSNHVNPLGHATGKSPVNTQSCAPSKQVYLSIPPSGENLSVSEIGHIIRGAIEKEDELVFNLKTKGMPIIEKILTTWGEEGKDKDYFTAHIIGLLQPSVDISSLESRLNWFVLITAKLLLSSRKNVYHE